MRTAAAAAAVQRESKSREDSGRSGRRSGRREERAPIETRASAKKGLTNLETRDLNRLYTPPLLLLLFPARATL